MDVDITRDSRKGGSLDMRRLQPAAVMTDDDVYRAGLTMLNGVVSHG